jgi:hypothetical protein
MQQSAIPLTEGDQMSEISPAIEVEGRFNAVVNNYKEMQIPGAMLRAAARLGLILQIAIIASTSALWQPVAEAVEWRGASQGEQDTQALEPNVPIERELAGGQVHAYRMTLAARQYFRIYASGRVEIDEAYLESAHGCIYDLCARHRSDF